MAGAADRFLVTAVLLSGGDWAAGEDPQLDTAVRLVLDALETRPAATPPEPPA